MKNSSSPFNSASTDDPDRQVVPFPARELILTSILTPQAFTILEKTGRLRASIEHSPWRHSPEAVLAHAWMSNHMRVFLGPAPSSRSIPLWAWYRYNTHPMPLDLRRYKDLDGPSIVVDLKVNSRQTLLSNFDEWLAVLHQHYLPMSLKDFAEFEALKKHRGLAGSLSIARDESLTTLIIRSWARAFRDPSGKYARPPMASDSTLQAALWEIRAEDVTRVRRGRR